MSLRILVTGSRGFLAGHLIARLRREQPRARLILTDHGAAPGRTRCELLDRERTSALVRRARPDWIFHLAGTTRPVPWRALWSCHVGATINLLDAVAAAKLAETRVWCVGSAAEYGDTSGRGPATESSGTRPVSVYGSVKLAQTTAALSYRRRGLRVGVARLFNILGPGMPEHLSLGSFAKQIAAIEGGRQESSLRVGDLSTRRDYLDARDAARALARLARLADPAPLYNVCSGRSETMGNLLKLLLAQSPAKISVASDPARRRSSDARECRGSAALLRRDARWRPEFSLAQSLRDTLDFYRAP